MAPAEPQWGEVTTHRGERGFVGQILCHKVRCEVPSRSTQSSVTAPHSAVVVTPQPRSVWGRQHHQQGTHPSSDTTPPHQPQQASPQLLPPLSQKKQEKGRILPHPTPWLVPFKQGEPSPSFSTSCFLLLAWICSIAANPRLQSTRTHASTRAYSAKRLLNFQQVLGAAGLQQPSSPQRSSEGSSFSRLSHL